MLPTVVPVQAEIDLHKRTPFRRLGLRTRCRPASCGLRLAFCVLHSMQEQNNVLPGRRPAAVARNDVVQIQILPVKHAPAILAGVLVRQKIVGA